MAIQNRIATLLCCILLTVCLISMFPAHTQAEEAPQPPAIAITEEETIIVSDVPPAPDTSTTAEETPLTIDTITADEEKEQAALAGGIAEDITTAALFVPMLEEASPTPITHAVLLNPTLLLLPQGGDIKTVTMPTDIVAWYSRFGAVRNLTASWRYKKFDSSQTGRQTLVGEVNLPEGYTYYESGVEAPLLIEQPVWVYGDNMEETEMVWIVQSPTWDSDMPFISHGMGDVELRELVGPYLHDQMRLETKDGYFFNCDYRLDYGKIDTSKSGYYYPYSPEPPPGIQIEPSELLADDMHVLVVAEDRVDLASMRISKRSAYRVEGKWSYRAENPSVWVTQDSPIECESPDWQEMEYLEPDTDISFWQEIVLDGTEILARVWANSLSLDFSSPPEEGEYWFQIRYDGGESDYLRVTIEHQEMTGVKSDWGGDRIGDTGGNKNPPEEEEPEPPEQEKPPTQPPAPKDPITRPPTPESPTLQPPPDAPGGGDTIAPPGNSPDTPGSEEVSDPADSDTSTPTDSGVVNIVHSGSILNAQDISTGTSAQTTQTTVPTDPAFLDGFAFTGAQLRALMAVKPDYVPFVQEDVEVWIPTGALELLEFTDDDVFAVRMEYAPGQSLTVLVTLNNQNIMLSENFLVGIPWDGSEAKWQDTAGNPVLCEYDAESGRLLLTFTQPGTVYLMPGVMEEKNIPDQQIPLAGVQSPPVDPPAAKEYAYITLLIVLIGCCGIGLALVYFRKRRLRQ
ncbi:hypothetical protein LJC56_05635 [Christensenellaceae bacterium OttesenSCG-928-K19]|nr:hypothetical protein [Christensenellaceae bacterium OttesenSCG-928-K19]